MQNLKLAAQNYYKAGSIAEPEQKLVVKSEKELSATYKNCEKKVRDLKRKQENLNRYLGRETTEKPEQNPNKNQNR